MEENETKRNTIGGNKMNKIDYVTVGDYEIPNLKVSNDEVPQLSRFGRLYLKHLKENEQGHYFALLAEDKLYEEVLKMDKQMNDQFDLLVKQMMLQRGVDEELKQKDQIKWVQKMNNIKNVVEEMIVMEFIK